MQRRANWFEKLGQYRDAQEVWDLFMHLHECTRAHLQIHVRTHRRMKTKFSRWLRRKEWTSAQSREQGKMFFAILGPPSGKKPLECVPPLSTILAPASLRKCEHTTTLALIISLSAFQVAVQHQPKLVLGQMRCMAALGEWGELIDLSNDVSAWVTACMFICSGYCLITRGKMSLW